MRIKSIKNEPIKSFDGFGLMRKKNNFIHGMYKSPEYKAWQHMKDRCLNKSVYNYCDYGGRGIVVCQEWKNDFGVFFAQPSIQSYPCKCGLSCECWE